MTKKRRYSAGLIGAFVVLAAMGLMWRTTVRQSQRNRQLVIAVQAMDVDGVRRALERGADPNTIVSRRPDLREAVMNLLHPHVPTPAVLFMALRSHDPGANAGIAGERRDAIVRLLLAHGANADVRDIDGTPAICYADSAEQAQQMLDRGARLNVAAPQGYTPLMAAISAGNVPFVRILIAHRTDLNYPGVCLNFVISGYGGSYPGRYPPLLLAMILANTNQASTNRVNKIQGSFPLRQLRQSAAQMVTLLLDAGANPNACDEQGNPLLLAAVYYGMDRAVNQLLDHGANPNATDNQGRSALSIATKKGYRDIERALRQHGATRNRQHQ